MCMRNQFSSEHEDEKLLLHKGDFSRDWKGKLWYLGGRVNLVLQLTLHFAFYVYLAKPCLDMHL